MTLIDQYKEGLLKGIVKSRTEKATGFSSLTGVTIYLGEYRQVRRGVRWVLTHGEVEYYMTDAKLSDILHDLGVEVKL